MDQRHLQAEITFLSTIKPQTHREQDCYLMDTLSTHGATTTELQIINRCRLCLQVARASDITNIAGTHLCDHVLPLERHRTNLMQQHPPTSTEQWPRQPRPGPKARKLWRKHLTQTLLQTDKRLSTPLGRWTVPAAQRDRHYPTYYDATSNTLHQNDGKVCKQLHFLHADRRTIQADLANPTHSIRITGYPSDIINVQNSILFAQFTARNARATTDPPGTCHHHRFGELPTWQADLLRHTDIKDEHLHLLESSPSIVVTDGGMEGGKGYSGVIIAVGTIIVARARGVARGDPPTMDSFRAEAYGLLAGICLIRLLTKQHHTNISSTIRKPASTPAPSHL
jgi:hypothetical protein